ncbi:1,4-dihydroxy-2-naphthoate polyprenyltransferase [bacterium]|nr:1,4-dihydroxy-2-naphthoate polyprenyltransferase [bacterium]
MNSNSTLSEHSLSSFRIWLLASRPKTLVAALMPVVIGAALASKTAEIDVTILLCIFASAICIQIGTNLANDYSDFRSGADTKERLGPMRITQAGLVRPEVVRRAALLVFAAAVLFGLPLIARGGWPILAIGLLSILSGWCYTGGPYPLGYNGLGELFVFLFFGLAAVAGTAFLLTGAWTIESLLLGFSPGMLASALLAVNNTRDIDTDRIAGKRTLAAKFGRLFGQFEYTLLLLIPLIIPCYFLFALDYSFWILLPLFSIPFMVRPLKLIFTKKDGLSLNLALGDTAKLNLIFGFLLSLGLVL